MYPPSQMNPCVSADGPKLREYGYEFDLEEKYEMCLSDALAGNHSTNADDCELQNAVARIVAMELKSNPKMFAIDSDPNIFTRIGYQVAQLVESDLNRCARFYAEIA